MNEERKKEKEVVKTNNWPFEPKYGGSNFEVLRKDLGNWFEGQTDSFAFIAFNELIAEVEELRKQMAKAKKIITKQSGRTARLYTEYKETLSAWETRGETIEIARKQLAKAIKKRDALEFWFKKEDVEKINRITALEAQITNDIEIRREQTILLSNCEDANKELKAKLAEAKDDFKLNLYYPEDTWDGDPTERVTVEKGRLRAAWTVYDSRTKALRKRIVELQTALANAKSPEDLTLEDVKNKYFPKTT